MIDLFSEKDVASAAAAKRRILYVLLAVTVFAVALNVFLFVIRDTSQNDIDILMLMLNIFLTTLYFFFLFFTFAIKYRLTNNYSKLLSSMKFGLLDEREGEFIGFDETLQTKDGVDSYAMMTLEGYDKRGIRSERRILIEKTCLCPEVTEGDRLRYYTHAGFLVRYEVAVKAKPREVSEGNNL